MRDCLRTLCVLAVFCGAALRLAPEGGVKRVMQALVSALLLGELLSGLLSLPSDLALDTARIREQENQLLSSAADARERMNRLVIEDELRTYIQNKAEGLGVSLTAVEVSLRWETEGLWLPDAATLRGSGEEAAVSRLLGELGAELGIGRGKLQWDGDDGN